MAKSTIYWDSKDQQQAANAHAKAKGYTSAAAWLKVLAIEEMREEAK